MTWWKGEDSWDDCEAFNGLSSDGVALFFRVQARMSRQMTDGVLTVADVERLDLSRPVPERRRAPWRRVIPALVDRGLLVAEGDHWRDPGWLGRNPSRFEIETQRRWDVLRQQIRFADSDEKKAEVRAEEEIVKHALWDARARRKRLAVTGEVTSEVTGEFTAPRPGPSSPAPSRKGEGEDEKADARPDLDALHERGVDLRDFPMLKAHEYWTIAARRGFDWTAEVVRGAPGDADLLAYLVAVDARSPESPSNGHVPANVAAPAVARTRETIE